MCQRRRGGVAAAQMWRYELSHLLWPQFLRTPASDVRHRMSGFLTLTIFDRDDVAVGAAKVRKALYASLPYLRVILYLKLGFT